MSQENYLFEMQVTEYTTFYELVKRMKQFIIDLVYNGNEKPYVHPLTTVIIPKSDSNFTSLDLVNEDSFVKSIFTSSDD